MSSDFFLIQFFCIISVIDMPRPVNTVHLCSRTYFEDQCLLIIRIILTTTKLTIDFLG